MARKFLVILILLLAFNCGFSQGTPPAAKTVLEEACRQASKENKHVMIIFHASWCGWCRKMDSSINDTSCRPFFMDHFVIRHLTVYESADHKDLENPGALALLTQYHGNDMGVPYWLVFDAKGNMIADAQVSPGNNSGCPAKKEEVDHLVKVLKLCTAITPDQESAIRKRFLMNDH